MRPPNNFALWEQLIREFVEKNRVLLDVRQRLLGEPHRCLGDIKLDNCFADHGIPFLIDPLAPVPDWRVLDRFIDAILIRAGLLTMGRYEEAEIYWNEYRRLYNESVGLDFMPRTERQEIEKGHGVMERIAYLQRLGLILSVSAYSGDVNTIVRSYKLLSSAYEDLESHLRSV